VTNKKHLNMSIEKEVDTTTENEVELDLNLDEETTEEETKTDVQPEKKPAETLEARKARLERQLAQTNKKLGLGQETPKVEAKPDTSNDLGEKAYLIANGIKTPEEINLAKRLSKETGKDIESLLATTYFQTELKDFREKKATADAIPNGNKRANNSAVDTVEYWIAKGELPPTSEVELRRKVVNAMIKKDETKGQFYNS
jgi:hypothetical protein